MININLENNKGFTLIELLVSISLFSIALVMALGAVLTIIDLNRKTQAMTSVTNNVNFAVESIVRIIKSAEDIEDAGTGPDCDISSNTFISIEFIDTYEIFSEVGGAGSKEVHYRHNCTDFTIERAVTVLGASPTDWSAITSTGDLEITNVEFDVTDSDQQKVEILIDGTAIVGSEQSQFIIQTTATRRRY